MADNKSSEEVAQVYVYVCRDCSEVEKLVNPIAQDGRVCKSCGGHSSFAGFSGIDIASDKSFTVETQLDINGTIKGLKAIQREAKKATAALKELEEQKKESNRDILIKTLAELHGVPIKEMKNTEIRYYPLSNEEGHKPHTVVFDEMHSMCPKCGSAKRECEDLIANEKVFAVKVTCSDCGYSL